MKISKVLVANRGEIAVRVIRAAKDSGILTVAIYADQDRNARFVRMAHEAYALNGKTSHDTYLVPEKILSIAKRSGADAIHPGYGFLSENADFAQKVVEAGLIWIGPSPESIRALGDKVSARKIAEKVGAPLAAGTSHPVLTAKEVEDFAKEYGLPVAIKAAYGGGGRGLKVAYSIEEIPRLFESATREAVAAFGRGECFVEKFLDKPRHVETQCLADTAGNVIVVSTRDCTLQRRHQKLIEEAPAPFLTSDQIDVLYSSSKRILREAKYAGAGTCEFLIGQDGTVSFLEVNTRLQVEHPVSEEVTGLDLVREQFRIAEGELLEYGDPIVVGHAIEFRINGEDPGQNFMPHSGHIQSLQLPTGPNVRIDSGIVSGDFISQAFDSLLMKVIVKGANREDAVEIARRVFQEIEITGVPTVIPFHRAVLDEQDFTGQHFAVHTTWIENEFKVIIPPWEGNESGAFDNEVYRTMVVEVEGRRLRVGVPSGLFRAGEVARLEKPPTRRTATSPETDEFSKLVHAPMQSTVVNVNVSNGDSVELGDIICTIEAMKMEQPVPSPLAGIVTLLSMREGEVLEAGQLIAVIEAADRG